MPTKPQRNRKGSGTVVKRRPSELLTDMRKVYRQPAEKDKPGSQVLLRRQLEEDPKGYMERLERLELAQQVIRSKTVAANKEVAAAVQAAPNVGMGQIEEPDDGSVRSEETIERLLKEWEDGASEGR